MEYKSMAELDTQEKYDEYIDQLKEDTLRMTIEYYVDKRITNFGIVMGIVIGISFFIIMALLWLLK